MPYLVKEKFNIYDLLPTAASASTVVMLEPEHYLAGLYAKYLEAVGVEVLHTGLHERLHQVVVQMLPALVIINPGAYGELSRAVTGIRKLLEAHPTLLVITVSHTTDAEDMKSLMNAGIASHVNRKLTRPEDIAHLVKTLLQL